MATSSQRKAALVLKHHGIIAHQTDTIFGLTDQNEVIEIFKGKATK